MAVRSPGFLYKIFLKNNFSEEETSTGRCIV